MMTVKINKELKQATITFNPKNDLDIIFEFNYNANKSIKRSHTMVNLIGSHVFVTVQVTTPETLDEVMKKLLHIDNSDEYVQQWAYCQWAN